MTAMPTAARNSVVHGQAPATGVAALTVVMVLFFIMALVAAYTNRNLVFEQRISANSYRVARAGEAAEAGLDWSVAMLNGGRIDNNCLPSVNAANADFRRRYLVDVARSETPEGGYEPPWTNDITLKMYAACIVQNGVQQCVCPSLAARNPTMTVPADGLGGSFRINTDLSGSAVRSGAVGIIAKGCASPGSGTASCYTQADTALTTADSVSIDQINVGLLRALPLVPLAALTTGGAVVVTGGTLTATNGSNNAALTVHAPTVPTVTAPGATVLSGPAGSGSDGLMIDTSLSDLAAMPNNRWFRSMFAIDPVNFAALPATRVVPCGGGACTSTDLAATLAGFPRNPVLVQGSLTLDVAGQLGDPANPVLLIVNGPLTINAGMAIFGLVHATSITWNVASTVQGAVVSAGTFTAIQSATLTYRQDLLDILRLRYGSFVRVPGSWRQLVN